LWKQGQQQLWNRTGEGAWRPVAGREAMVRIVHISDLHISEHLTRGPERNPRITHRYGHDVRAFLALDSYLKSTAWDLLLVTGDISRVGEIVSFEAVRNWLENELVYGETRVGLNLSKSKDRHYVVIPGNHDRFNGGLTQGSLDNYHSEFPSIRPGSVVRHTVDGVIVNLHLFDSTYDKGGFAFGKIEDREMVPKRLQDEEVDLALLHHHFLQPPKHPREIATELVNSSEVASYMLNSGFDGVLFGHTHKGYIGRPSVEILSGLLNDKRKKPRFWSRLVPKFILRKQDDESLVSYNREPAKNGQLPTLASYFDYLFLRQKGCKIKGPGEFEKIADFYTHLKSSDIPDNMQAELRKAKEKKILISLAPSACQAEADWNGFHVIEVTRDPRGAFCFEWDRFEFEDTAFKKKDRLRHVS
jgi:hypothetical protein